MYNNFIKTPQVCRGYIGRRNSEFSYTPSDKQSFLNEYHEDNRKNYLFKELESLSLNEKENSQECKSFSFDNIFPSLINQEDPLIRCNSPRIIRSADKKDEKDSVMEKSSEKLLFSESSPLPIERTNILYSVKKIHSKWKRIQKKKGSDKKKKRGMYRVYSIELKRNAVNLAEKIGLKEASLKLNIPEKNILRWKIDGPERKKGAGRKLSDPKGEMMLLNWIKDYCKTHNKFPMNIEICQKALTIIETPGFRASKGWFDKFMVRNKDVLKQFK